MSSFSQRQFGSPAKWSPSSASPGEQVGSKRAAPQPQNISPAKYAKVRPSATVPVPSARVSSPSGRKDAGAPVTQCGPSPGAQAQGARRHAQQATPPKVAHVPGASPHNRMPRPVSAAVPATASSALAASQAMPILPRPSPPPASPWTKIDGYNRELQTLTKLMTRLEDERQKERSSRDSEVAYIRDRLADSERQRTELQKAYVELERQLRAEISRLTDEVAFKEKDVKDLEEQLLISATAEICSRPPSSSAPVVIHREGALAGAAQDAGSGGAAGLTEVDVEKARCSMIQIVLHAKADELVGSLGPVTWQEMFGRSRNEEEASLHRQAALVAGLKDDAETAAILVQQMQHDRDEAVAMLAAERRRSLVVDQAHGKEMQKLQRAYDTLRTAMADSRQENQALKKALRKRSDEVTEEGETEQLTSPAPGKLAEPDSTRITKDGLAEEVKGKRTEAAALEAASPPVALPAAASSPSAAPSGSSCQTFLKKMKVKPTQRLVQLRTPVTHSQQPARRKTRGRRATAVSQPGGSNENQARMAESIMQENPPMVSCSSQ